MPSNQEYKGKGIKGRNYDELSGVGTPDLADAGNLRRAKGQPGGTPAQGDSTRSPGNRQGVPGAPDDAA